MQSRNAFRSTILPISLRRRRGSLKAGHSTPYDGSTLSVQNTVFFTSFFAAPSPRLSTTFLAVSSLTERRPRRVRGCCCCCYGDKMFRRRLARHFSERLTVTLLVIRCLETSKTVRTGARSWRRRGSRVRIPAVSTAIVS